MIGVPRTAVELAKRFEGFHRVPRTDPCRAHPYICPAGYWTIGYGHLCDPKHAPITGTEAEVYLARDLQTALTATLRYFPVLAAEPEGRLPAIVDFAFNRRAGRLQTYTLRWPVTPVTETHLTAPTKLLVMTYSAERDHPHENKQESRK